MGLAVRDLQSCRFEETVFIPGANTEWGVVFINYLYSRYSPHPPTTNRQLNGTLVLTKFIIDLFSMNISL